MATDLTVYLDDRPGKVAAVGEALGAAGVNIEGGFALVVGGQGIMHVLVEDADAAVRAQRHANFEVRDEQEALVIELEDRPGALGEVTRRIADAGVNLTAFYVATATRVVVCAEDLDKARAALSA
jgi:hypothetical protein